MLDIPQPMQKATSTNGTAQPSELWDRIAAHDFKLGHPLGFICRLARDKGWTQDFAEAAVMEYRRFCFLAVISPTPVTPSEEVDEVWHMHLTYTRDYWDIWCAQVLGRALHHDPTRGSPADQAVFRQQYAATLALYELHFGPPPELFWPATHRRFRFMPRFRTMDADRHFRLPKPSRLLSWIKKGTTD